MSIKVSKLYREIHEWYINCASDKAFHSAIMEVELEPKSLHIRHFAFEPTEFCRILVMADEITIDIDGYGLEHGVGVHEPDLLPVLLKAIARSLREARCNESTNMGKWIGSPLLTAMVKAGYIEQIVSWRLK